MPIKITNRNAVLKGIKQAVINQYIPDVVDSIEDKIAQQVREKILIIFNEHPYMQSLLSEHVDQEYDLPAIFGLDPASAFKSAQDIANLIEDNLQVNIVNKRHNGISKYVFVININEEQFIKDLLNLPSSTYDYIYSRRIFLGGKSESRKSDVTLPWMDWFINGVVGINAEIEFDDFAFPGSVDGYTSRSGRAIMISGPNKSWSWPGGIGWIIEIFNDARFLDSLEESLKTELSKAVKNITKDIG